MTLEILEARVSEAMAAAPSHASACNALVEVGDLQGVVEYCVGHGVKPPQCSLTAQSENARRLRTDGMRKMADASWWRKSLEVAAIQRYEAEQVALGNVTHFVSDGLFAYQQKLKAKK